MLFLLFLRRRQRKVALSGVVRSFRCLLILRVVQRQRRQLQSAGSVFRVEISGGNSVFGKLRNSAVTFSRNGRLCYFTERPESRELVDVGQHCFVCELLEVRICNQLPSEHLNGKLEVEASVLELRNRERGL